MTSRLPTTPRRRKRGSAWNQVKIRCGDAVGWNQGRVRTRRGEDGKTSICPLCSLFLSLSLSFTPSRFRGQGSGAPAVAAWLWARAGVWTKTKAGAVRGAEPAAPPRRQWTPETGPLFLHSFLPSFLHSVILALFRVYFIFLSFLRTRVLYTGIYMSRNKTID